MDEIPWFTLVAVAAILSIGIGECDESRNCRMAIENGSSAEVLKTVCED